MEKSTKHYELQNTKVKEMSRLGYGNPEASISYDKQLKSGELLPDVVNRAIKIIESGRCICEVDASNDGCIDGRPTINNALISDNGIEIGGHEHAKVAGGGYLTSLVMDCRPEGSVDSDLRRVTKQLADQGICCGAHTGEHKHGDSTDCGANDKIKTIFENATIHRKKIAQTTQAVLETAEIVFDQTIFDSVIDNWSKVLASDDYFANSTGESRFMIMKSAITESGEQMSDTAVKHLLGNHKEDFIILNFVANKTFSQKKFAQLLAEAFPDLESSNRAQTFVVDVWRIVELAKAMSTSDDDIVDPDIFQYSLYAGTIFQLSTAATLTDGSLRNFIITK